MSNEQNQERRECAMAGCHCADDAYDGVELGGRWYCSHLCGQGRGCDHPGCGCSDTVAANQGTGANLDSIPGSPTKPVPKMNPGHLVDHNPGKGSPATRRQPDPR